MILGTMVLAFVPLGVLRLLSILSNERRVVREEEEEADDSDGTATTNTSSNECFVFFINMTCSCGCTGRCRLHNRMNAFPLAVVEVDNTSRNEDSDSVSWPNLDPQALDG